MLVRSGTRAACLLAGSIAALLAMSSAHATVYYWDTVTTSTWATAASWSDNPVSGGITGSVPLSTDVAFFNQSVLSGNKTVQLDAPASIAGITFYNYNNNSTLINSSTTTPQALTIGSGGILIVAGNTVTLGNAANPSPVVLGAAQTWTNLSGSVLTVVNGLDLGGNLLTLAGTNATTNATTITGVISNGGLSTATVGNTVTLNGSAVNTFTGGLNLNGGTLLADYVNLTGTTPFTNLIDPGNTLGMGGGILIVKGRAVAGNTTNQTFGNVTLNTGGGQILGNVNGGTATNISLGSLTTTTAGGSLLLGVNTLTTTAGLTLTTASAADASGIYGGRIVFFSGTANTGYDWATSAGTGPFTLSGLATGGYTAMVVGATSDALNTRVAGAGISLTGSHAHNSLKLEGSSGTLAIGANLLTLTSGGLLVTGTTATTISNTAGATGLSGGNGSGAYDLVIHQYNSGGVTLSAVIGDNAGNATALTKSGSGALILSGANTYTGPTTITAGNLQLNAGGTLGSTTGTLTNNGALTFNNSSNALTVNNNIVGIGSLTLTTGTVTLGGTNTYAGATAINGGTLNLNGTHTSAGTFGVKGASTVNINAGAVETMNGPVQFTLANQAAGTVVMNVAGTLNINTTAGQDTLIANNNNTAVATLHVLNGGVVNVTEAGFRIANNGSNSPTGTVTMDAGSAMTFDTIDNGNGLLIQSGGTVAGPTGTFNLNGGVLTTGRIIRVNGSGKAIFNFNGGTLKAGLTSTTFMNLTKNGVRNASSKANVLAGGAKIDTNGYAITISEPLLTNANPDGGLTKLGSGTLTLSGACTFNGPTTLTGGTLSVATIGNGSVASGNLGSASNAATNLVFDGGMLRYTGVSASTDRNFTINSDKTATIDIPTATLTVSGASAATNGALTKTGAGTLILSGNNANTGSTTVSAGALYLSGSNATSAISMAATTTLGGIGSAASATATVASGGIIEAGAGGSGQLGLGGLAFSGSATMNFGTPVNYASAPGVLVSGSGLLSASGGSNSVTINVSSLAGITPGVAYKLIGYSGSLGGSGFAAFKLGGLPARATGMLSNTGSGIDLTIIGVGTDSLVWTGDGTLANGWDSTTPNWKLNSNNSATTYINPSDVVVFNDSASNTNTAININTADVSPSGVSFNNSTNAYALQGSFGIAGTTGLVKSGSGPLTIATANTYTGATTLDGGVVTLDVAEIVGTSGPLGKSAAANPGSIILNGSTLQYSVTNANDYSGRFSTADNQAYNVDTNGVNVIWATALTSSGTTLTKSGTGTLTLTGNSTYTGATTISEGTLQVGSGGSGAAIGGTSGVSNNSVLTFNHSDTLAFGQVVDGSGLLTQTGSGTLTLSGTNTHLGGTTLSGGTLNINNSSALGSGTFTIANGTTINTTTGSAMALSTSNPITWSGSFTFGGSNDLDLGLGEVAMNTSPTITTNAGVLTVGGNISGGANGLTKAGGGTLTFSGNNSYTGTINLNAGTFNVNGGHSSTGSTYLKNSGTVLNINGTETVTGAGQVIVNWGTAGTCTVNVSGTWNLGGSSTLIGQEGTATGVVNILSGGAIHVTNGEFRIGNTSSNSPTGIVTMVAGSLLDLDISASSFVLANGGTGGANVKGTFNLNGGVISTARAVTGGIGTATFNFNGGTLKANLTSTAFFSLGSNAASRANVRNGGAFIDSNGFDITIPRALLHSNIGGDSASDGGLTKNDEGTLTLSGINTYTGNTSVSAGTLALADNAGLMFVITDLSNNKITGAGAATLDGDFTIDTAAVTTTSGTWILVDVATKTFGATFTVSGAGWTETADVWTKTDGSKVWTFSEATGTLSLSAPYDTWAAAKGLTGVAGSGSSTDPAPAADPDHDAHTNLEEYALDGNPLSGINDGKVVVKLATLADSSKVLTLTLPLRRGATFSGSTEQVSALIDGVIYSIQGSDTLAAAEWTLAVTEITGDDATAIQAGLPALSDLNADSITDWTYRTFRSPGTVTDGTPGDFLRAKVVQP